MAHPLKGAIVTAAPAESATTAHRNEVYLVGELSTAPEERELSDGREAVTFRLDVRAETDAGPTRDSLDITVIGARARKSALTWAVGDVIEVEGVVRRKFYKLGSASKPFTVVEAQRAKRLRR
jgi:single-strand DNA-binding protein